MNDTFNNKINRKSTIIFIFLLIIQLRVCIFFGRQKEGFHVDEYFSYTLANSDREIFIHREKILQMNGKIPSRYTIIFQLKKVKDSIMKMYIIIMPETLILQCFIIYCIQCVHLPGTLFQNGRGWVLI